MVREDGGNRYFDELNGRQFEEIVASFSNR